MIKLKIRKNFILDILFILTYSIGYASLLKYVTYVIFPLPESIQLFLFLFFLYLFRFGGKYRNARRISSNVSYFLFFLYFWEIFQGMIVGAESNSLLVAAVNLSSTFVAYRYMSNLVFEGSNIKPVITAYSSYLYYTFFIVVTSSVLILSHVLDPYSNQLGVNSLFKTNMESQLTFYYFPGCLSVVYNTPSVFLFPLNFPSLSGLSHESQAMYFTIFPALFLMFYLRNSKSIERYIIGIFLLLTILTTSLTAAICFMLTFCLHLFWKFKDNSQIKSALAISLFVIVIVVWVVSSEYSELISLFFLEKANFDSDGSSGSYSLNLLSYIVSPTDVLGKGIFCSTEDQAKQFTLNCGYLSSMVIICFYLLFFFTSIRNIFSKKIVCHAIGLASFYFMAHSFKYGTQVFNNCYLFFIVFLLSYAENVRKNKVVIE